MSRIVSIHSLGLCFTYRALELMYICIAHGVTTAHHYYSVHGLTSLLFR